MRVQKAQAILLQKIWVKFIVFSGVIGTMVGLWFALGYWAVIVVLALLLGLTSFLLLRSAVLAQFICEEEEAQKEATRMLKETEQSLYYYGGAGFIGNYQHWREEYGKKLNDKNICMVRFLDLKSLDEMKDVLKSAMRPKEVNTELKEYAKWLTTHSRHLKHRIENNRFYEFEGAPIWKYGPHWIIFDRKHILFPFLSAGKTRSAICIHNCPDIAGALADSLDWLTHTLALKEKSGNDLSALARLHRGPRGERAKSL